MVREIIRNCLVAFSMAGVSVGSALAQPGVSDPSHWPRACRHPLLKLSRNRTRLERNTQDRCSNILFDCKPTGSNSGTISGRDHPLSASRDAESSFDDEGTARYHFLHNFASGQGLKSLERAQSCHALASDPRCFVRATSSRKREETSRINDLRITSVRLSPRLLAASSSTSIKERGNDTRIGLLGGKVGFRLCIPHHGSMECAS